MKPVECHAAREWLQEELDGELSALHRASLRRHLADCAECRAQEQRLAALAQALAADVNPVPAGFRDAVLAALPAADWEARRHRAWVLAAAALVTVLLAAGSFGLVAGSIPGLGAVGTVGDLIAETLVVGAGLAGASWRGLRLALAELRQAAPLAVLALGLATVVLNVALWRLLRGRPAAAERSASHRPPP